MGNNICKACGKEIPNKRSNAKYCIECRKARDKEAKKRYYIKNNPNAYKEKIKEHRVCDCCGSDYKVLKLRDKGYYCEKHYNQMYRYGETHEGKKKFKENKYIFNNDIVEVYTVKNEKILIDKEDYGKIKDYYWSLNSQGYAISVINGKHKRLHLMIIDKPKGTVIDHINGDKLDNRKSNLRICTQKQNSRNTKLAKNNTSGVTGVYKTKYNTYSASIMVNRKQICLGTYKNIKDAIKARREAEEKYFGEFKPRNK